MKSLCNIVIILILSLFSTFSFSYEEQSDSGFPDLELCIKEQNYSSEQVREVTKEKCAKLFNKTKSALETNVADYILSFSFVIFLLVLGGALGGVMSVISFKGTSFVSNKVKPLMDEYEDEDKDKDEEEIEHRQENDKQEEENNPKLHYGKNIFVGIGAAFVGVTFLGSFIHMKYEYLVLFNSSTTITVHEFIETCLSVIGLSVISGYSGVKLVERVADNFINEKLSEMEKSAEKRSHDAVDILTKKLEEAEKKSKVQRMVHDGLWGIIKGEEIEDDKEKSDRFIRDGVNLLKNATKIDKKNIKGWRWLAYGLKRLNHIDDAISAIKMSLALEKNVKGYYNLACYQSVNGQSASEVVEILSKAFRDPALKIRALKVSEMDFNELWAGAESKDIDFSRIRDEEEFQTFIKKGHV